MDTQQAADALLEYRRRSGLDPDSACSLKWRIKLGPLPLVLPNFAWRQRAIAPHDLHHLLTGIPCTMPGEFQMAAWEFGAGRLRNVLANAFCLPLVVAGLLSAPQALWRAYKHGLRCHSLYVIDEETLMRLPLDELRRRMSRAHDARFRSTALGFFGLCTLALLEVLLPVSAIVFAVWTQL